MNAFFQHLINFKYTAKMTETEGMKRVKRKIKSTPNPLFELWLKEWREEAKKNGSEMQYCFGRALKSLQKYPFRLETGKECFILENFGTKLCMMLDKKLSEYQNSGETSVQVKSSSKLKPAGETHSYKSCHSKNEILSSCKPSTVSLEDSPTNSGQQILIQESVQKRKSCMDSPARILKHVRDDSSANCSKQKKNSGGNTYLPTYRSGGYAILLTLHKICRPMTKAELEIEAQKLCDAHFKKSSDSHYTAWSSMSTLVKKGLVEKTGRPARFSLTAEGMAAATNLQSSGDVNDVDSGYNSNELLPTDSGVQYPNFHLSVSLSSSPNESGNIGPIDDKDTKKEESINDFLYTANWRNEVVSKKNELSKKKSKTCIVNNEDKGETFFLLPNEFDVILYVDHKEIDNKKNVQSDKIVRYLQKKNVKFEVKNLNVGDYLWICRDCKTNRELVLPYIVERKRMDDLASSVKDGRFHEQKFRLKNCGLHHCIYLVEKYGNESTRLGLPLPTIQQAISNTKVIDGFDVKLTNNNDDSLSYLSHMTKFLTKIFKDKTLVSCSKADLPIFNMSDELIPLMSFPEFNKDSGKMRRFTVRNMLIKHLLQLNGVSVERARAIVKVYPTAKSLMEALQRPEGESMIAGLTCGALGRSVGSNLAKSLQQLYTLPKLN